MGNLFSSAPAQPEPTSPGPVFDQQAPATTMGGKKGRRKTRRGGRKGKGKGKGRK
jgi:hypothetical protein